MTEVTDRSRSIGVARPIDHAAWMESSRARLSESRRLYRSTAVIIRETRETIDRTLEMLGIAPPGEWPGRSMKKSAERSSRGQSR
jgi:hypothetical protein